MAADDTLAILSPFSAEFPTTNYATAGTRNNRRILEYDDTGNDVSYWTSVMPQSYTNVTGVTVIIHWTAVAVTGDVDWDVAFERVHATHDTDTNGFAVVNSVDGNTVPATSGFPTTTSILFTAGADMDSVVKGDLFRVSVTRDSTADTAAGNIEVHAVEIRER